MIMATLKTTAVLSTICCVSAFSQVIVPPQPGNKLSVSISAAVSKDSTSGLYTYSYTVKNAANSSQELWFVALELSGDAAKGISNATSPKGWTFLMSHGEPTLTWAATQVDNLPANFVDDGGIIPSMYQVKPGQSLSGFSFQSAAAPTTVKFYGQGFTQLPDAVDAGDLEAAGYALKGYVDDSVIGVTQAPSPSNSIDQPSGLGFFNFVGLINGAVRKTPVTVGVHFNMNAGLLDPSSFTATLNGKSITKLFKLTGNGSDLTASLDPGNSTLVSGTNILLGTVSGTPSTSTQTKSDLNHIRFYVNTTRSLDLNGDGAVDCLDVGIVKASFGKKTGQPGFDPRADVNGDGVVDVRDLAAVSRQLPAATHCQ
jgi:hypothetical protein